MTIKPKMFLNASPQTAEEGSLVYAKNIKVDNDGNIVTDYGYVSKTLTVDDDTMLETYKVIGHIVGLNEQIYFLCLRDRKYKQTEWVETNIPVILLFNEHLETFSPVYTSWAPGSSTPTFSTFSGAVTTNISGEQILTIAEVPYNEEERVPLKHINLSYAQVADQSLYCQAPKIPLLNLLFNTTYSKTIPNGTYVFFVRYKIREGVFTKWYLASRPCFAGTSDKADTLQGGVEYINIHRDSANSFVFDVEAVYNNYASYYKGFQVGFIITHDEGTDARIWKYFDFSYSNNTVNNKIYFDYEDVQETNIDDLLEPTYEIYNVKNVTVFKNQLYISNYVESEHNVNPYSDNNLHFDLDYLGSNAITSENRSFNYAFTYGGYNNYVFNKLVKDIYTTNTQQSYPWNSLDYGAIKTSYSSIVKESEKTFEKAFSLVVGYDLDINPDIVTVYDIKNNLKTLSGENSIFPGSWPGNKYCAFTTWEVASPQEDPETARYKWNITYNAGGDKYTITNSKANAAHPFYNSNNFNSLTYKPASAYGCIRNSDEEHKAYKLGVTSSTCTAYPISSGTTYAGSFTARNEGFAKETKILIIEHLKKYIEQFIENRIIAIELYSGTNSYVLDCGITGDNINKLDEVYYLPKYINASDCDDGVRKIGNTELNERGLTQADINSLNDYIDIITSSNYRNHLIGLTYTGELVFDVGKWYNQNNPSEYVKVNTIKVKLRKFKFEVEQVDLEDNDNAWYVRLNADCKVTDYAVICNIGLSNPITYNNSTEGLSQRTTLMPLGTYDVYMHNIDEHGIISDGYKIRSTAGLHLEDIVGYNEINLEMSVTNNRTPTDPQDNDPFETSCFISIVDTGNITVRCFDYNRIGQDNYLSCIELDALLLNETTNLTLYLANASGSDIYDTYIVNTGVEYLSSGTIKPAIAFGNCGLVHWTDNVDYSDCNCIYLVITRNITGNNKNKELMKLSPYFHISVQPRGQSAYYDLCSYTEFQNNHIHIKDCFYPAYVCNVRKPSFELSSTCYAVGNEVYAADRTVGIKLTDFEGLIQQSFGSIHTIISPFNLNYLSLTQDLKDTIFKVGSATSGVKQVVKILDSATLSYIYELKSMYKDFMNVYFRPLQDNYKTVFDNTVRVSNVLSDETFNNDIYRFGPTDYYNIPTNRGVIVKLFSIGSSIYAHTKLSLYKFDGSQMLVGNNTDIQLKESEPFDAGITQLFDSEYGYGGISEKSASCVTFDSYFFYDKESNHIFAYKDNQPVLIDGTIKNFLDIVAVSTTNCTVLPDILNNRVLFNFRKSGPNTSITLSYNYKTKSFVSLHDLNLKYCFNSRQHIYYNAIKQRHFTFKGNPLDLEITHNIQKLFVIPNSDPGERYGSATQFCGSFSGLPSTIDYQLAIICYPTSNITEVLNYIKYIGSHVKSTYKGSGTPELYSINAVYINSDNVEDNVPYNPVDFALIITDRCKSNLITEDVDDTDDTYAERQPAAILNNVKKFKFDKGTWNFNYFRNVLHQNDDFKYANANGYGTPPNGYEAGGGAVDRTIKSDYNSLIYGRYFIIAFALKEDRQVKMEEIFISTEKY